MHATPPPPTHPHPYPPCPPRRNQCADSLFLTIKYAQAWKKRVFPHGFKSDSRSNSSLSASSPMRLIMRRHEDNSLEVIQGWALKQL